MKLDKIMNTESLEYMCSNGTTFKADRCDLKGGVRVLEAWETTPEQKMADFAEFGAWHLANIHPNLNGFAGYGSIKYSFDS